MKISKNISVKGLCHLVLIVFVMVSVQNCSTSKNAKSASESRLWEYKTNFTNLYSWDDEIALGKDVQTKQIAAAEAEGVEIDPKSTAALKKRIEKIAARLTKVSDHPELPYEVHIYDQPEVANAFCMPGGKIGFFTGIFDEKNGLISEASDDEIAAVLGHEIAHATLRHVTRHMTTMQSAGLAGALVGATIGASSGSTSQDVFNQAFNVSASLYFPSYSRKHETEADKVGFYYLTKAGFDPQAAVNIWERLDKKLAKDGKGSSDFFSSHPSSGKRADFLAGYLPDARLVQQKQTGVVDAK